MNNTTEVRKTLYPRPDVNNRPDFYMPSDESLDFLLDHQISSTEALAPFLDRKAASDLQNSLFTPWEWSHDFLEALQWRIGMLERALESRTLSDEPLEVNPEFAGQRAELSRLLNEVMVAYVPALTTIIPYHEPDGTGDAALLELLRSYWVFNRRVMAFATEVWGKFYVSSPQPPMFRECECQRIRRRLAA